MKKSLKDKQTVITPHAVGENQVLLNRNELGCNLMQIAVTDIKVGEIDLALIHPNMQEELYVLDGKFDVVLNNPIQHCHKDDFAHVETGTTHELQAITIVRVLTIGCVIDSIKACFILSY